MKTFKFPAGTSQISKKELAKVFSEYERVEIPGTVFRVNARFDNNEISRFIVKELVLNEGILSLILFANNTLSVNIPKSLLEIHTNALLPQVLCLPESFNKLCYYINGVEYLQAYSNSDVRYCFGDSKLKHYVYLGEKNSRLLYLFDNIPAGCVIHVESKNMARNVLKKVNVDKVYVIPDALEWKDFPADKLAQTMEEYDPESRILTKQIELREEKRRKEAEEALKQQEMERKERKDMMVASMAKPIIESTFCSLCDKIQVASMSQENANGEEVIKVRLLISDIQWITSDDKTESTEFYIEIPLSDVAYNAEKAVAVVKQLKDVFGRNQQLMQSMETGLNITLIPKENTRPMLVLPVGNGNSISAYLNWDTMTEDSKAMRGFVKELTEIIETAKTNDGIFVEMKYKGIWF